MAGGCGGGDEVAGGLPDGGAVEVVVAVDVFVVLVGAGDSGGLARSTL